MVDVIRVSRDDNPTPEARREWLVTNGIGGFADNIAFFRRAVWFCRVRS